MAETWMACYRQRRVHVVPADVQSPAYCRHGLIDISAVRDSEGFRSNGPRGSAGPT
jgi:hypothetical protein